VFKNTGAAVEDAFISIFEINLASTEVEMGKIQI
jgi:hypothetical protein